MNPPHSEWCEQGAIAAILLDNQNFALVDGKLEPEDFYLPAYAAVFSAIQRLSQKRLKIWPGTVSHELSGTEFAEGFKASVDNILQIGAVDILTCTHVIKDCAYKRRLMAMAKTLTEAAEKNESEICAQLQQEISTLSAGHSTILPDDPLEQIQSAYKLAQDPERLLKTGLQGWDDTFGGLAKGARYIIAGRAGSGKTALALNILWNVAKAGGKARHIFFEGTVEEVWFRIMSRETSTPITSFRKGLTEHQTSIVSSQQDKMIGVDFAVVRDPRDVGEMIARCGACDVICVDGISSAPSPGAENLIERVQMVTAYCKTLADRTGAAVIMLAHLNSEGVKVSGTGTGIYGGQAATFDPEGIMELKVDEDTKANKDKVISGIVTKNRYGENNTVKFMFNGERMKFNDWQ